MIIGIDASRANLKHKTGTEWYSFYLIKNLAEIDHRNTYRLYLNKPPRPELMEAVKHNPNFSFNLLRWPFYSFWTLGRLTLEMLWRRPDILFVPAHALPLFGPLKTVNTIHDVAFFREQNLYRSVPVKTDLPGSRKIINFLVRLLTFGHYRSESVDYLYWSTPFALYHAKKIIAVSDYTKREILDIYPWVQPAKITVVHNGYNTELYPPVADPALTKKILEKYDIETPYFLYVGRLEKKKNTPTLVEAFALLRENHPEITAKLVLIGDASFGYDEVQYMIQDFNLGSQVIMPGWVDEADLPYIFSGASAFVFPSKYEGFGIPVLQALACGTPVAMSDLPVLREVAGDAALYFDQNSKEAIAAALARISSDQALRAALIVRGREQVKDFSWRRCAEETLQVLENL
jgi:glycosyltransferase involved in cell wall biosynthesis